MVLEKRTVEESLGSLDLHIRCIYSTYCGTASSPEIELIDEGKSGDDTRGRSDEQMSAAEGGERGKKEKTIQVATDRAKQM